MEELSGKAFDRLNTYIQKYNNINDTIEEGRQKKLGELMQDAPAVDYVSFCKSISADYKSSKVQERIDDNKILLKSENLNE